MKRLISQEVARKDLCNNIKLGSGGIREIEFITQVFQLVRGGRVVALRTPSLLTALHMSVTLFGLTPEEALLGVTCHAARALGRDDIGSLVPGRRADFTFWDVPEPAFLTYQLGGLAPRAIFIEGQRVNPK